MGTSWNFWVTGSILLASFVWGGMLFWVICGIKFSVDRKIKMNDVFTFFQDLHPFQNADLFWADSLQILAGYLRAGFSLRQTLPRFIEDLPTPLARKLSRKLKSGFWDQPIESQIDIIFDGNNLKWVRAGLHMAIQTGGPAAHLIERCAEDFRTRMLLQEKIKTLTAQGRASAWIVGLSPLALMAFMGLISPESLLPLFSTPMGVSLVVLIFLLVGAGLWVIHRMVAIKL